MAGLSDLHLDQQNASEGVLRPAVEALRTYVPCLLVGEQDGFVVLGAIEDVQDVHGIKAYVIENQVIAMGAAAHAGMFVAWHQREGTGHIGKGMASPQQLAHETFGAYWIIGGDVVTDMFEV